MNKLSVIGTAHHQEGACKSDELLKIVDKISPQVIFCEASPKDYPAMLKAIERFNTPEIKVLRTISARNSIEIIPVDLHGDPFDNRLEVMFELFRNRIKEYYYATKLQINESYRLGFPFLNSKDSDQIHRDKNLMEEQFVERVRDMRLSKTRKEWLEWNDDRENHWIQEINRYFEMKVDCTAVFLVGSAHRIRLMEKVDNLQKESGSIPQWDFFPFK